MPDLTAACPIIQEREAGETGGWGGTQTKLRNMLVRRAGLPAAVQLPGQVSQAMEDRPVRAAGGSPPGCHTSERAAAPGAHPAGNKHSSSLTNLPVSVCQHQREMNCQPLAAKS